MIARIFRVNGQTVDVECDFVVIEQYSNIPIEIICRDAEHEIVARFVNADGWAAVDNVNEDNKLEELIELVKHINTNLT